MSDGKLNYERQRAERELRADIEREFRARQNKREKLELLAGAICVMNASISPEDCVVRALDLIDAVDAEFKE